MTILLVAVYAFAIILANLLVASFGPSITPLNAFFLIGLDLALRNYLSFKMSKVQMGMMIIGTGLLSYSVNPAAGMIALASCVAFTLAALVDWITFNTVAGKWMTRNLAGNSAGALVDSIVFPTIAFGSLMPMIVLAQFAAKVAGGTAWGYLIHKKLA
tara:strand:+ start:579 stop:1052 length:474 start_codon:yes stop_codon:yes gene_type:complete